jgi:microcystin-dependent protein
MAQPYVGEIRMFAGNFPPNGWMFCEGQMLPISENEVLFQLIGTTYGGDGQETFCLPNLQGRIPIHMGTGPDGTTYQLGEMAGTETVTLTVQQIPIHTHALLADEQPAEGVTATGSVLAETDEDVYGLPETMAPLSASTLTPVGGSQPHENMQPFLTISFIISLFGIFPQQN